MNAEIWPEPNDEERGVLAAVLQALERGDPSPYDSAWRRSGLEDADDDQATAPRPRRSRGATRA
jgi:hypothetical protein